MTKSARVVEYEGVDGSNNFRSFNSLPEAREFIADTKKRHLGAHLIAKSRIPSTADVVHDCNSPGHIGCPNCREA
jgi:hypothetical protein